MANQISVVINTLNEEEKVQKTLKSVSWADEVIVCDMHSDDNTVEAAKKLGAKVYLHPRLDFVEPARNFAISKASKDWVLILDPDEEVPGSLVQRLKEIAAGMKEIDFVKMPRKNIIFNHFMKASMWWPDYNIRFFRKGKVTWTDKIHQPPQALGQGLELEADEKWAILHNHYHSVPQFLERMIRYTKVQAEELKKEGYKFDWKDLIKKPLSEFLSRFFANRGYEDGLYGMALSFLQAFSFLIVYLRVWEMEGFEEKEVNLTELKELKGQANGELDYWFKNTNIVKNPFKRFFQKIKNI